LTATRVTQLTTRVIGLGTVTSFGAAAEQRDVAQKLASDNSLR